MNYSKLTNYAAKDLLLHGDPRKAIKGTEVGAEFDAIAIAIATKVDSGANIATVAASQIEMETGTEVALRSMSPLRVAQAIESLGGGNNVISSPKIIAADTSYIVASYLKVDSDLTINGNIMVILWILALTWATWILFIAVMGLKRARDAGKLSRTAYLLGLPALIVGVVLDVVVVNIILLTVLLLELPSIEQLTASARLHRLNVKFTRYGARGWLDKWRFAVVRWAEPLLDPFDTTGNHI